jgi:hypothetical protein
MKMIFKSKTVVPLCHHLTIKTFFDMKLFELDCTYFCAMEWATVDLTITDKTIFGLMRAFLNETCGIYVQGKTTPEAQRELWNDVKDTIAVIDLPIIRQKRR